MSARATRAGCQVSAMLCGLLVLAGCTLGPRFQRPAAPSDPGALPVASLAATAGTPVAQGESQHFVVGADLPADWWTLFQSPALSALIEAALHNNPGITAAREALRAAQEGVYAQRGFFFPAVQLAYQSSYNHLGGSLGGNAPGVPGGGSVVATNPPAGSSSAPLSYSYHTAQLSAAFAPDVFGANRRAVESLQAQAEAARFELEAAYTSLASNVAGAALQAALLRAQGSVLQQMVDDYATALDLLVRQQAAGYESRLDVLAMQSNLAQAQMALPPLRKLQGQTEQLLRALVGGDPGVAARELSLAELTLPVELPVTLPAQLVEHRPDIRAAEAQLHSACALVGVAVATRLPQFSIGATLGGAASQLSSLLAASGTFLSVQGSVVQTLTDGGTLRHRQRAAEAGFRQAEAQYRGTVLLALEDVANALAALSSDAEALQAAARATSAAEETLQLTRRQWQQGQASRLEFLAAEQNWLQATLALRQAQAGRLGDTVALYQALGGGWWHRDGPDRTARTDGSAP